MNSLPRKVGWHVYHFVHTNGMVADFVYWAAFYVQNFFRSRQYKKSIQGIISPPSRFLNTDAWSPPPIW